MIENQRYDGVTHGVRRLMGLILWATFTACCSGDEGTFGASPYKIGVFVFHSETPPGREFVESVSDRCRALIGRRWELQIELSDSSAVNDFRNRFSNLSAEDEAFDKIVVVEFQRSGKRFEMEEFDLRTRRVGPRVRYTIDDPDKTVDLLVEALLNVFRPIAKLERATPRSATFQVRGAEIFRSDAAPSDILVPGGILMPFLHSRNRDGRTVAVTPIPWTVLIAEEIDPVTRLLRCRIESGLSDPFGARFRGRTAVFALSVPTPSTATVLRMQVKQDAGSPSKTLPSYEVFETLSGEPKLHQLGQSAADGTFVLEPVEDRPLRNIVIRKGRTVVARLPIVRGWEAECLIPIPDDRVRLEAEASLLGLQEELIDVTARREILTRREKKYRETGDLKMAGEMRNELARLKEVDRFLIDLEQARLRFQSTDPIIRRRLERMFRETEDAIKKQR